MKIHKKLKWPEITLIILFIILLGIKIFLSFQSNNMNYESYFHLNYAKNILNGQSLDIINNFQNNAAIPIISYVLSFFGIFLNLQIAAKILISIFTSSIILIIYLIVNEIVKDKRIALISALFSAFIPLIFKNFINNFSTEGISIIIYLITLLFFIKSMNKTIFIRHFIICLIILILISPLSLIFISTFVIYFLMLRTEKIKIRLSEIEIFLFSLILGGWIYIIIYKEAIIQQGFFGFLHPIITTTTQTSNLIQIISMIGVIPALLGIIGIYYTLMKKPIRRLIFIVSFIITAIIFMIFNIVEKGFILSLIGLGLIICSGIALREVKKIYNITKAKKIYHTLIGLVLILFIITSIVPSITNALIQVHNSPSESDIKALLWIKENVNNESTILGDVNELYVINYFSDRDSLIKQNKKIKPQYQIINETSQVFNLTLDTETIRILSLNEIDYVFLSENSIKKTNNISLKKFETQCFSKEYSDNSIVYKRLCTIKDETEINKELFQEEIVDEKYEK